MKHKIWIILIILFSGTLSANETVETLQQKRQHQLDKRKGFEELLSKKNVLKSQWKESKSDEQQIKQKPMNQHLYPRGTIATH